ncbi:MAG: helix-turn-helix domain-containing protein [Desulfobulbaceae bacterium]|nr:helix-turn-helix domain-containing protein [Desulfobulbaceae bacterium]
MNDDSFLAGSQAVEQIDGAKVRALRESKELTQLYVATVVGVTTDTISRWENRRYPTIKRENALKLAELLEVELAEILETEEHEDAVEPSPAVVADEAQAPFAEPVVPRRQRFFLLLTGVVAILALAVGVVLFLRPANDNVQMPLRVVTQRILPPHVAPGQSFPVLIRVETAPAGNYSMIVRETVPLGCMVVTGLPSFATLDETSGTIKWIGKAAGATSIFSYLARVRPTVAVGKRLTFDGAMTLKKIDASTTSDIGGPNTLVVKKLHWADANGDGRIDDDEILSVYDRLETMDELGFGKPQSRVEEIWAGNGYRWDEEAGQLVVIP